MTDKPSYSRMRIQLAQYLMAHEINLEELYACLGADTTTADETALSHIAGVLDGMALASSRIRQHGLDDWTKGI